ncbi:YitT family protein [Dubosiella muris]|uniref:YitT family protein n=1 Tax=Dubosiella muris TaxID=3038133 RepID=A0AC61R9W9_9FIRM|nr:YitT family protein [Dubosiella muris]TGY67109.1 YitT family protein [Dubosiella muris]
MIEFFKRLNRNKVFRLILSLAMVCVSAFLQVYIINVFMDPCNLISGGFTGIALFMHKAFALFHVDFTTSAGILLLNIPAALLCAKAISKRFVLLSTIQFSLVSLLLTFCQFEPLFTDQVLNILFGGVLWGFSISLALKAGGSTGGTDFIAQYVSNKIHKGIWDYVFYFNCFMYVCYGFVFGWKEAGYSIIFQFLSTKTISSLYQRYEQITIEFTTAKPQLVIDSFMSCCRHGMSIIEAHGAYSNKKFYICKTVVSSYQAREVIDQVRKADPKVIVNTYKTANFYGNFYQQPIE